MLLKQLEAVIRASSTIELSDELSAAIVPEARGIIVPLIIREVLRNALLQVEAKTDIGKFASVAWGLTESQLRSSLRRLDEIIKEKQHEHE